MLDDDVGCVLNDRVEHHAGVRNLLDRDKFYKNVSDDGLTFGGALGPFLTYPLQRCDLLILSQLLRLRIAICHQSSFDLRLKTCFVQALHLVHQSRWRNRIVSWIVSYPLSGQDSLSGIYLSVRRHYARRCLA